MKKISFLIFILFLSINLKADNFEILKNKLLKRISDVSDKLDGVIGIAVKDLKEDFTLFLNQNEIFPQASSIKIVVLLEVFKKVEKGELRFDEFVPLKKDWKVGGSGILQYLGEPSLSISIKDLCTLMISLSDNTATNILIERVGMNSINERMRSIGLKKTILERKMMDISAVKEGRENISTPYEMMCLLEKIWKGEILKEPLRTEFLKILSIPKDSFIKRGVSEEVPVASKPGALPQVRCESGIVLLKGRPYIFSIMTSYLKNEEDGELAIVQISKVLFDFFSTLEKSTSYGRGID